MQHLHARLAEALAYRQTLADQGRIDTTAQSAYRLVNGEGDGLAGLAVDVVAGYAFVHIYEPGRLAHADVLAEALLATVGVTGVYAADRTRGGEGATRFVSGMRAPDDRAEVHEGGLRFGVHFAAGPAFGLYLDQRNNRRNTAALAQRGSLLNTFSYTCSFSVHAAHGGARTLSVDQSKAALETGKANFALNRLPLTGHRFLTEDVFVYLPRLGRKGEQFSVVLLDPPTFARGKKGVFAVEKDYAKLVAAAAPLVAPGGVLIAFANTHRMEHALWYAQVREGLGAAAGEFREIDRWAQAPDFRERGAEGYLKNTVLRRKS
jgi:23S rRNA (cytosine1962-C5)-methyltransferase